MPGLQFHVRSTEKPHVVYPREKQQQALFNMACGEREIFFVSPNFIIRFMRAKRPRFIF